MLDFEVEISSGEGGSYRVSARSPAGDVSGIPVRFPLDELELHRQLQVVELALLRSVATTRRSVPTEERPVQQFGRLLFEFVFPRLIPRMTHPGGVYREAPGLDIFPKRIVKPGISRVGMVHDRLEIIRNDDLKDAPKNAHAASKSAMT